MGWFGILGNLLGIGKDVLGAKAKLKMTKLNGAIAVTQKKAESIATWEQTQAKASESSWKDEFWTVIWSIPVILSFVKFSGFDGPAVALDGFAALKTMPDWYTYTLMTIVLASFGIRLTGTVKAQLAKWKG